MSLACACASSYTWSSRRSCTLSAASPWSGTCCSRTWRLRSCTEGAASPWSGTAATASNAVLLLRQNNPGCGASFEASKRNYAVASADFSKPNKHFFGSLRRFRPIKAQHPPSICTFALRLSCLLTLTAVQLHRPLGFTFCQRLVDLNSSQQQRPVRGRSHNLVSLYRGDMSAVSRRLAAAGCWSAARTAGKPGHKSNAKATHEAHV